MLQEADIVATLIGRPDLGLVIGEVGAVVMVLSPEAYEVEFVDENGQTYAMAAFRSVDLLKLHHRARAA